MASSMLSSTTTVSRNTPAQASMVAPFTGLRSAVTFPATRKSVDITTVANNGGRVSCMQVWPTENMKRFETLSYLPPLTEEQLIKQIEYLLRMKLIPCLEIEKKRPYIERANNRSPGYYDGRYWTMWKLPMFGCTDPIQVVKEIKEVSALKPDFFVRVLGFDPLRQVQITGFVVYKPPGSD